MLSNTFKGGVHPEFNKENTAAAPIEELKNTKTLIFPMVQHIGAPCEPVVKTGDRVLMGQKIADGTGLCASIYSSVSGYVSAVEPRWHINGTKVNSIVIDNDFKDEEYDQLSPCKKDISELTSEEIIGIAKNAGLVGMGGAAFPTHAKIESAAKSKVNFLIINGAECEPYITSDHRAMIEYPRPIAKGIELVMKALNVDRAYIAIEDNKLDAVETMYTVVRDTNIKVVVLKSKYPQGGEKQLIKAITGIEVPAGKLPMDVGCAVFNVDTCASLYRAFATGMPLIKRVVTVSGSCIKEPKNLLVRIGTPINDLIEYCGSTTTYAEKYIAGGPMMGTALVTTEAPVIKSTNAVLAFDKKHIPKSNVSNCIRCGKCQSVCPMNLSPLFINKFSNLEMIDECEKLNVMDCIECGSCSFICPAKLHLVQTIRKTKAQIRQNAQRKKEGKK